MMYLGALTRTTDTEHTMGNQHTLDYPLPELGVKIGRFTVVEIGGIKTGHRMLLVQCDCGTRREVSWPSLRRGLSRSCGCLHQEATASRNRRYNTLRGTLVPRELAWAAGFFDGEGTTTLHVPVAGRRKARVIMAISQSGDSDLLDRFEHAVGGVGTIVGPYAANGPKGSGMYKPVWRWQCSNFEGVQFVICCLWADLGDTKRLQAALALTRVTRGGVSLSP